MSERSQFTSVHTQHNLSFSPDTSTDVLTLEVRPPNRGSNFVKLDTSVQVQFTTDGSYEELSYSILLRLNTNSDLIATAKVERNFLSLMTNTTTSYTDLLNLTWDHRISCDETYTVSVDFIPDTFSPQTLRAQTRSLNATVYPDESCEFFF